MIKNRVVVVGWALLGLATVTAVGLVLSKGPAVTPAWASNTQAPTITNSNGK